MRNRQPRATIGLLTITTMGLLAVLGGCTKPGLRPRPAASEATASVDELAVKLGRIGIAASSNNPRPVSRASLSSTLLKPKGGIKKGSGQARVKRYEDVLIAGRRKPAKYAGLGVGRKEIFRRKPPQRASDDLGNAAGRVSEQRSTETVDSADELGQAFRAMALDEPKNSDMRRPQPPNLPPLHLGRPPPLFTASIWGDTIIGDD